MYVDKQCVDKQRGFTLVELLVVIAIIGVLVALLLPAVQAARESARRNQCINNLKQIALSILVYHDEIGTFPPGRKNTDQYGESWAFRILPQSEQQVIYDSFDREERVDDDRNATAMRTPVSVYFCPTRRTPAADRDFDNDGQESLMPEVSAGGDYAANAGLFHNFKTPSESGGPAIGDNLDPAMTAGPIYSFSKIAARHVTDGLSNTFAVGERHIPLAELFEEENDLHLRQGDTAFFAADTAATIFGCTENGLASGPNDSDVRKFGSEHSGLVHFAFLDGRVIGLSEDIELAVLQQLSVIGDGGEISEEILAQDL